MHSFDSECRRESATKRAVAIGEAGTSSCENLHYLYRLIARVDVLFCMMTVVFLDTFESNDKQAFRKYYIHLIT